MSAEHVKHRPQVHVELTDDDDHDFPPHTFVAYCDACEAGVAWRSLVPFGDWVCDNGANGDVVPVTTPGDCACPNCGARHQLPTFRQLVLEPKFRERLEQLAFDPRSAN